MRFNWHNFSGFCQFATKNVANQLVFILISRSYMQNSGELARNIAVVFPQCGYVKPLFR